MSALFFAIPLTIFVLFVAPIWLWLHYNNKRNGGSETVAKRNPAPAARDPGRAADARTY